MKKSSFKTGGRIVQIALVLIVVGIGMNVFGFCMGGRTDIFPFAFNFMGVRFGGYTAVASEDIKDVDFYEEYNHLERLVINTGVCELNIEEGDKFSLEGVNVSNYEFEITSKNNKLTIDQKDTSTYFMLTDIKTPKLTITIPSNVVLENVELKNGVGSVNINELNAKSIKFKIGVGSIDINELISEDIEIAGGVGEILAKNIYAEKLDIKGGVGDIYIEESRIDGKIIINGGIGKITLELLNEKDEYDWDVNTGLGSVTLNNDRLKDNYKSMASQNNYKITVKSGIGNIEIKTE